MEKVQSPSWQEIINAFIKAQCAPGICLVLQGMNSESSNAIYETLKKYDIPIKLEDLTKAIAFETFLVISLEKRTSIAVAICKEISSKQAYCTVWVNGKILLEN